MAYLRFSRDKRGYENFYLVQPTTNRRGKVRARVLYFYRTPPDVKIGREPFDLAVRHALETQNPDVMFDWRQILETPIPSAETERWRERRRQERAERAARQAAVAEETDPGGDGGGVEATEDLDGADAPVPVSSDESPVMTPLVMRGVNLVGDGTAAAPLTPGGPVPSAGPDGAVVAVNGGRKRRRRRRGRRGQTAFAGPAGPAPLEAAPGHTSTAAAQDEREPAGVRGGSEGDGPADDADGGNEEDGDDAARE
jgi:hypothetical protein